MQKIKNIFFWLLIFLAVLSNQSFAQKDSINNKITKVIVLNSVIFTSSNTGLYFLWYKNYKHSKFHWFSDEDEWLQMDKLGHFSSTYYISRMVNSELLWADIDKRKSARISALTGFLLVSTVEIFDGFSDKWGASWSDLSVNFIGSSFYLAQEEIWNEQRIVPKFSFSKTNFSSIRPNAFGYNLTENILKDYNGQTYWLSVNINSFLQSEKFPNWLNLSLGYGANGMLGGKNNNIVLNGINYSSQKRERQFYLSLDIALDRIKTKSKFANKVLKTFNVIKIPFPAIELRSGNFYYHLLYF